MPQINQEVKAIEVYDEVFAQQICGEVDIIAKIMVERSAGVNMSQQDLGLDPATLVGKPPIWCMP